MSMNTRGRGPEDLASDKMLARRALARIAAIAFLVAAGAIHTAQIRIHLAEWNVAGLFFIASAVAQLGLAVALTRGVNWRARDLRGLVRSFSAPLPRKLIFGVIGASLTLIGVWTLSRAVGMPFGPDAGTPEPVNRPDSLATMFELLTLGAMLPLLSRTATRRTSWTPHRAHTVIVGALLLSTLATTAVALQPVTCEGAPRAEERLSAKEQANQALIDAFVNHAGEAEHSADAPGRDKRTKDKGHATGDETSADDCH